MPSISCLPALLCQISVKEAAIVGGILAGYLAGYAEADEVGGWRAMYLAALPLAAVFGVGTVSGAWRGGGALPACCLCRTR
jgi:MFS family permease